ncbi:MAG: HAD family hydrolase [Ilumatobacter sp.]
MLNRRAAAAWLLRRRAPTIALADLPHVDLEGFDVVSFDVFDTCIGRAALDPTDLFVLVPERAEVDIGHLSVGLDPGSWFRRVRIEAERTSRTATQRGEVDLTAIYRELLPAIPQPELLDVLHRAELELEFELSLPRLDVRRLAIRAHDEGRRVAYLSDMYLPSSVIRSLLDQSGFPAGDVLVSNEIGCSKASGEAYEHLRRHTGVPADRTLHVGDNLRVDGLSAAKRGVRPLVIERATLDLRRPLETHPVPETAPIGDSIVLGMAVNGATNGPDSASVARRVGSIALGPCQLAFASWVAEQVDDDEHVMFCSRDMRDVQAIFDRIAARDERAIDTTYLEVSRRSIGMPALAGGIEPGDREFLIGGRGLIAEAELWGRIGLGHVVDGTAGAHRPLAPDDREHVWTRMLAETDTIVQRAMDELDELRAYWAANDLPTAGSAVVVDVGWRATMQRSLVRCIDLMGFGLELRGLYLGLLEAAPTNIRATGWLVDAGMPSRRRIAFEAGIPVVELAFQAAEGSADHYSGGLAVRGPTVAERAVQDHMQEGAGQTVEGWFSLGLTAARPGEVSALPLLRLLNSPRPHEARVIGTSLHTDRLGTTAPLGAVLPGRVSLRQLLGLPGRHPTLRSSEWRPGMMALGNLPAAARLVTTVMLAMLKATGRVMMTRRQRR